MAKTYGGRWELIESVARGGQGEVFRVKDLTGEHTGELVLKRVLNPRRHDRFKNEVEAVKRLDHPNIIRLIDHSALSDDQQIPEKQFLVMPFAASGELSARVMLYKDNVDSVVQVAKQLANGLAAAHQAGIVHRDVKPQNILFPTSGHDVWLSDFGICLIRDQDRATDTSEVVGPAQFIAPELEGGGRLEVTGAADVYSLGKVIYFMLSGGTVLPRERLHDAEYVATFERGGERQRLLQILLAKMICPAKTRLQSMAEVLTEIDRIESWASAARLLPVSPTALAGIEALQRKALDDQKRADESEGARSRRVAAVQATRLGILGWLKGELEKTSALIGQGGGLASGVRNVPDENSGVPGIDEYRPGAAVELWVQKTHDHFNRQHVLRFSFCGKISVQVRMGGQPEPPEPEHANVAVLPTYAQLLLGATPSQPPTWQLLTLQNQLHPFPSNQPGRPAINARRQLYAPQAAQPVQVQMMTFSTDQWPAVVTTFSDSLKNALDTFIAVLNKGGPFGF